MQQADTQLPSEGECSVGLYLQPGRDGYTARLPGSRATLLRVYVASLRAFRTILYIEANGLAFCEGLKTAALNCAEVYKHVCAAIVLTDEAEALGLVKPLYCTCSHVYLPLKKTD